MKYLKITAVAIITMFATRAAKAQVVVSAHIGTPPPPAVVVERPVERTVVVERPVQRRVVVVNRYHHRPRYRRVVVVNRHHPYRRHVIVRHY